MYPNGNKPEWSFKNSYHLWLLIFVLLQNILIFINKIHVSLLSASQNKAVKNTNCNMIFLKFPAASAQTDHQSSEDMTVDEELWQLASSQWSHSLLGLLAPWSTTWERERERSACHTARFTPSHPPETYSAWRHATIFNHAVIGITHVHATPLPQPPVLWIPAPPQLSSAGSLPFARVGKNQLSMNIEKGC